MKKCGYCGHENFDNAEQCRECGTKLESANPPVTAASKVLTKPVQIWFRLLAALGVGLVVTMIATWAAWLNTRTALAFVAQQWRTRSELKTLDAAISRYRTRSNALPSSFADLIASDTNLVQDHGTPVDGWGRPFAFSTHGTNWLITSYGRDGKPGGRGLDCDLTSKDPNPEGSYATLPQFLFELPSAGVVTSCIMSGLLAAVASFLTIKSEELNSRGLATLIIKLGVTILAAVVIASFIAVLHVPSGH